MKIIFIRHGEPNYNDCDKRNFIGQGREFAPLTDNGILQAEKVAKSKSLCGAELIVSSPYTRALQTAAIISRHTQLPLCVETDLHELIPDKSFDYKGKNDFEFLLNEFCKNKGFPDPNSKYKWETIDDIISRTSNVLSKYNNYKKIIVVSHGGVIRRYVGKKEIEFCKPYEVEYNQNFNFFGWID